ncbi:MAG: DUF4321 domain-containing protein [Oscillospiraceae bacterium]|nr:DUF4321 domain-containing protein [Oscillospiraceae bacterium]
MKLTRKGFVFIILIISAIIIGAYISAHTNSSILSYTAAFGFGHDTPMTLDLIVITLSLGFTFNISIAQIFCIICAVGVYAVFSKFID